MVPDAIDLADASDSITRSGEDVDLMAFPLESRRQFRHMRRHTSDRYRMERFPGEHGYAHSDPRLQRPSLLGQCQGSMVWLGAPNDVAPRLVCDSSLSRFESNCFQATTRFSPVEAGSHLPAFIEFEIIYHCCYIVSFG